jgi:hypothetical protein
MALDKVQLLNNTGIVAGSYVNPSVTVTSDGRITSISSGGGSSSGTIAQTVTATVSTLVAHTTVWAPTGLTASITPTSSNSKILVVVNQPVFLKNQTKGTIRLRRDGVTIYDPSLVGTAPVSSDPASFLINADAVNVSVATIASFQYLDSPGTTSAVTYLTQGWGNSGFYTNSGAIDRSTQADAESTITLYEIYYP